MDMIHLCLSILLGLYQNMYVKQKIWMKYLKHVTILLSMYQVLKDTKGMLNKEKFALMKNGARLLNFARGDLVVNEDLLEAVESGKLSKYITDFASQELIGKDNIIVLPHLGASTPESEDNCAKMAVQELKDFLENGNIKKFCEFPSC